ncbi:TetR/AcrR family transcriptional regulator [Kineococcus sp. R86509]|uniref:TetR/AcrR family transcriptional regulator n=1 Tax=Kineococcus sp. R86509 TaxID=3093851 RepID=UPI0036D2863B
MDESSGGVRDRTIAGGGLLFTRQGYAATTMRGIVAEAGTPWGSVHHYFPGGKEEVALAAIDLGDRTVRSMIRDCLTAAPSLSDAVRRYFDVAGSALSVSNYEQGCPVATVALEQASMNTGISAASRVALSAWARMWAEAFTQGGIKAKRADELGTLIIVGVEGSLLLSRVTRTLQPMRLAAASLAALIDAELPR